MANWNRIDCSHSLYGSFRTMHSYVGFYLPQKMVVKILGASFHALSFNLWQRCHLPTTISLWWAIIPSGGFSNFDNFVLILVSLIILFCDFISSQIGRKAQLWSSKQFVSVSRWEEIKSQRSSEKQSSTLPQKELSLNFKTGFDNNLTLDHFFPHPNFLLALTDSSASDPTIRLRGISFLSQRLIITLLGLIFSYVLHVKL